MDDKDDQNQTQTQKPPDASINTHDGLAYWEGIGGNPNTQYQVLVTVAQNGRIVPGGSLLENGRSSFWSRSA